MFFMRLWFHIWCLCCPYLLHISPSFGASVRLCFVIVLLWSGYIHLHSWWKALCMWVTCKYETQLVKRSCEVNSANRYRLPEIYNVYTSEQMLINIFHHSYRHLDNLIVFIYFVRVCVHCSHGFLLESFAVSVLLHYNMISKSYIVSKWTIAYVCVCVCGGGGGGVGGWGEGRGRG